MNSIKRFFSPQSPLSAWAYLGWGILFFMIKFPVDYLTAQSFQRVWNPVYYFSIFQNPLFQKDIPLDFRLAMITAAVPFVMVGIILTVRRLITIGRPPLWATLFFLPFLNLPFFIALLFLKPTESSTPSQGTDAPPKKSAVVFLAITSGVLMGLALLGFQILAGGPLGYLVFLGIPFFLGYKAVSTLNRHQELSIKEVILMANAPAFFLMITLLALLIEGIFCVTMATPLVIGLSTLGGLVGYSTTKTPFRNQVYSLNLLALPLAFYADTSNGPSSPTESRPIETRIVIDAPPEDVWPHVVTFPEIEAPWEGLGAFYIPVLKKAIIKTEQNKRVRYCIFEEGSFREPIKVWNPPHELTFRVTSQIAPFDAYLQTTQGQFKLIPQGNHTLLVGTTWVETQLAPAWYWNIWSDLMIHKIHNRALSHIKRLSESS